MDAQHARAFDLGHKRSFALILAGISSPSPHAGLETLSPTQIPFAERHWRDVHIKSDFRDEHLRVGPLP